jgi:cytochrome c553
MYRVVLILGALAGCSASLPTATATDASRAHLELADLQHGRALVVSKCGSCHRPPLPTEHGAAEWPLMLDEMSARANLDFMQRRLIEGYLVTMAMR